MFNCGADHMSTGTHWTTCGIRSETSTPSSICFKMTAICSAAVLSLFTARVFIVEWRLELVHCAAERLHRLGYLNVEVRCGDGPQGLPEFALYDVILVAAAAWLLRSARRIISSYFW